MGPVKLEFAGKAKIVERDDVAKRMVIDASGSDKKGRGQATMTVTAVLTPSGSGTKVAHGPGPAAVRCGGAVRPRHDLRRHRRS